MRLREKRSVLIVTLLTVIILGGLALLGIVPREQKVFDVAQPANGVQMVTANSTPTSSPKMYKQQDDLDKLNALVGEKTGTRVFQIFGEGKKFDIVLTSNFDKSRGYSVDEQGRVLFIVDKGDIRNKSTLHWVWWKINSLYDKSSAVEYMTDPDDAIANQAKLIVEKAGQAQ